MVSEQLEIIMNQVQQLSTEEQLQLIKHVAESLAEGRSPASVDIRSTVNTATRLVTNPQKKISSSRVASNRGMVEWQVNTCSTLTLSFGISKETLASEPTPKLAHTKENKKWSNIESRRWHSC